jgi:hypothetical protein
MATEIIKACWACYAPSNMDKRNSAILEALLYLFLAKTYYVLNLVHDAYNIWTCCLYFLKKYI